MPRPSLGVILGAVRATFLPFSPPSIGDEEVDEVVDTLRSDWITTGPKVARFEEAFATAVDAPAALAVSSCTDALQIALAALGVGPGDAVFTTTMTFVSTVHVIEHVGAEPVLVDIDAETLNIDPAALADAVRTTLAGGRLRPRAVIPVHHGGQPCDMSAIIAIAREFDLAVVEDAAHALPAMYDGVPIGRPVAGLAHAVAFSFYATKNLTTAEGGMLTAAPDLVDEARLWSLHGMSRDAWKRYGLGGSWFYEVVRPGYKCNMTDLQAAIGLHQLAKLPSFQARRRQVAARFLDAFGAIDEIDVPLSRPNIEHAWHLFVIRLRLDRLTIDRARFIDLLAERNIGASVHFIPVHLHPWYRDRYGFEPDDFPVAWREYHRLVSLPIHPRLDDRDVDDVIEAVTEVVRVCRA